MTTIIPNHLSKHNKADSIRKFIWHIQTHVSALKSLALPVDEWDAILMHLTKKKARFHRAKRSAESHKESHTGEYAKIVGIHSVLDRDVTQSKFLSKIG